VSKSTGTSGNAKEDAKRKTPTSVEMKGYGRVKVLLDFFSNMAALHPGTESQVPIEQDAV
jgi:hypothetical protein